MDVVVVLAVILLTYFIQRKVWAGAYYFQGSGGNQQVTVGFLDILFLVHLLLFIAYISYAYAKSSDSFQYYTTSSQADTWWELWGKNTPFIRFFAWPFSHLLGLSYNAVMLLFSFFGFEGIVLLYLSARENIGHLRPGWGSVLWCMG